MRQGAEADLPEGYYHWTFANGLRLLGQRLPVFDFQPMTQTAICAEVVAGAAYETGGQRGGSLLVGLAIARQLKRANGHARASVEALGSEPALETLRFSLISQRARNGQTRALWAGSVSEEQLATDSLEANLRTLARTLRAPELDEVALSEARAALAKQMRWFTSDGYHAAFNTLREMLYVGTALGRSALLSGEEMDALTTGDARAFHAARYTPDTTRLVVVGDFEWEALVAQVGDLFGDWAPTAHPLELGVPRPKPAALVREVPTAAEEMIALAFPLPGIGDADGLAAELLMGLLGGYYGPSRNASSPVDFKARLVREARDFHGVVSSLAGDYVPATGLGMGYISARTRPEDAHAALRLLLSELRTVSERGFTEEELTHGRLMLQQAHGTTLGNLLVYERALEVARMWQAGRVLTQSQMATEIEAVTNERLVAMLRRFPPMEKLLLVAAGPVTEAALLGRRKRQGETADGAGWAQALLAENDAARDARAVNIIPEDARIYLGTGEWTVAVRATDGAEIWRRAGALRAVQVAGEVLYGLDADGTLAAIGAADGVERWRGLGSARSFHAATESVTGVTADGAVFLLNVKDGTQRWQSAPGGFTQVMATGLYILALSADGEERHRSLEALSAADGARLWTYRWRYEREDAEWLDEDEDMLPLGRARAPLLALSEDIAFLRTACDVIVGVRLEDGVELWRLALSTPIEVAPLVRDGVVYVATNGRLFALRAEDGAVLWRYRAPHEGIYSQTSSSVDLLLHCTELRLEGDRLLMPLNYTSGYSDKADSNVSGMLYAVRASDGVELWRREMKNGVRLLPAAGGGLVCAVTTDPYTRRVFTVDAADGVIRWARQADTSVLETGGSGLALSSAEAGLSALDARSGEPRWSLRLDGLWSPQAPAYERRLWWLVAGDE